MRKLRLCPTQGLLCALVLSDIAVNFQNRGGRSVLVASQRLAACHDNGFPLTCDMCQLTFPFSLLLESNINRLPRNGEPGLQKLVAESADGFLRGPAVGLLRSRVPECDSAFGIAHDNGIVRQVQQLSLVS